MGAKIGYGIALAAGIATILGWIERSQWVQALPGGLQRIVSQPWFLSTAFALTILALMGTGGWRVRRLESGLSALGKRLNTVDQRRSRVEQWKLEGGGDTAEAFAHRTLQSIDPKQGGMDVKPGPATFD